ncbi:MAG TPA: nucleotide exchange factor GrpE [Vicinamibacteria bacterium]|nr:nucleotide exchange factor GrpE [Vicinamibacteria bacterium]
MHDDDPAQGSESPEQDPLAALLRPAERSSVVDPGAADAFQQRANLAEDRLAEVLNAYRQLKTENEGFRDRITRNLERRFDQRRERLLLKFIEILDNLDRALEATEQTYTGTPMIEGIILVRTQLLSVLQEEGLERIPVLAMPYDPSVAEAVETRPVSEPEHHHVVVKELMRGYRLHGRVARASRVAVGEYTGELVPAPETTAASMLVGADEAKPSPPAPAPPPQAAPAGVRGVEAALDDLIAPDEVPSEIDLLKEVLDEDES